MTFGRRLHCTGTRLLAAVLLAALLGAVSGARAETPRPPPSRTIDGFSIDSARVAAAYGARPERRVWTGSTEAVARADAVLAFLARAYEDGLDPHDYAIEPLARRLAGPERMDDDTELLFTHALLEYVRDMKTGRVAPRNFDPNLYVAPPAVDLTVLYESIVSAPHPVARVAALAPAHPEYRRLRRALAEYRQIRDRGGFTPVPAGPSLRQGDQDERVADLRQRLTEEGYLAASTETTYTASVQAAVGRFQANHGLEVDGIAGRRTLAAMNESVDEHIRMLILNLERWRWLPDDLGRRHVRVNIADFSVRAMEGSREVGRAKAIVGKPARMTPVFSSVITQVLFQPYWYVPERIAREDILPQLQRNPAFLAAERFTVFRREGARLVRVDEPIDWGALTATKPFPYVLRQDTGPRNALGPIKFDIVNDWDIYMHGTPAQHLFASTERAYSSGCIRLETPLDLAHFIFEHDPSVDRERIDALYYQAAREPQGPPVIVPLSEPIPVHILYWTAWADEAGDVHFVGDVYGRDRLLAKALSL